MAAQDQGFREFGAKLVTQAGPYDPFAGTGDKEDSARYLVQPGANFMRPWLAIRNGPAFQWPVGLQGFMLAIDPTLGSHKYIGDNAVDVEVLHAGEEHFTMNGNFPGDSAPDLVAALRDVVYQQAGAEGKLLWLPEIVTYVQKVEVVHFDATRDQDSRGRDFTYSIEFVRKGIGKVALDPTPSGTTPQPTHRVTVDGTHNTLRKIAQWKLGSAAKWRTVYNANQTWFVNKKIILAKAPDYKLPIGLVIKY